ncbi:hypothetical protein G5I_02819 [Acromyrmex echinatior]|uniref:Uncharacterized protein n=1 Tax=Acromyrmex echinatior TaxID=103372 RepID=F4WBB1_ACREC|nr:hypothetical protein G5I_02819 [Acromyrmex echinatior]
MSDEIAALLTAQSDLHGRMARSVTNLRKMGTANITLRAVEVRSTLLDKIWAEFENQHKLIRALYKEAFDLSEYNTSQFADSAENTKKMMDPSKSSRLIISYLSEGDGGMD